MKRLLNALIAVALALLPWSAPAVAATTQLPPGQVCFVGDGGQPMVNGSLNMFFPSTTTPKTTWTNSSQTSANTQPIQLDANGCAIIYGVGTYRQQLYDGPVVGGVTTGNLIFDLPTTDTSAYNSVFWAALAGGTPNAITITYTGFNATDGTAINFIALNTNTGATTLNPSGYGAISIEKQTTGGPVSLTGGEIVANNIVSVVYSATLNAFLLTNPPIQSASGNSNPLCGMSGLKITNNSGTPATEISMSANDVVTINATGLIYNRINPSVTINASITGANGLDTGSLADSTWYYVWWIDNGSGIAGLLSLSSTAPALPNGYTTECRAGAMTTDGSGNLMRTLQLGRHSQYIVGTDPANVIIVANGVAGTYSSTSPVLALVAITGNGNSLPPTASVFYGIAEVDWKGGGGNPLLEVAPNANWGGTNNGPGGTNGNVYPVWIDIDSVGLAYQFSMALESGNIYWACNGTAGALGALGWEDQVNAN